MGKIIKTKKLTSVPTSVDDLSNFVSLIGETQKEINKIEDDLNAGIKKLREEASPKIKERESKISELMGGVYSFAKQNRKELTGDDETKTIKLSAGDILWRTAPPGVIISKNNEENVLNAIKSMKLSKFIRTTEEINREAMLADPEVAETIKGVTIGQKKFFIVKPLGLEKEIDRVIE